jgi:hypothetical protein
VINQLTLSLSMKLPCFAVKNVGIIWYTVMAGAKLPLTWYPESFTAVPMTDMNMRSDPSRGYPGRTYRFYTGPVVYSSGYGLSYSTYSYSILQAPKKISLSHSSNPDVISRKPAYSRMDGLDFVKTEDVASCESLKFSVRIAVSMLFYSLQNQNQVFQFQAFL